MKLQEVIIHNIRSIQHTSFQLSSCSMLVGENNVGKTNILTALRLFYEDGGLKYKKEVDSPKFANDSESWVELAFKTTEDEQNGLKNEYKSEDRVLRVRRYIQSQEKEVKTSQSNIYAYESGELSNNLS